MRACGCKKTHRRKRIVLTGGPGGGKTAVLETVRHSLCQHVRVLPESAGIVFGGGFPRDAIDEVRRSAQRAIFHVQRELEAAAEAEPWAIVLCDRGTVDGGAYWPGPGELFEAVGTTLAAELARYDAVIHLRTPPSGSGYGHTNPLRVETASQALAIDEHIARLWSTHPHVHVVEATADFLTKAKRAVELLEADLPECCRGELHSA